MSSKPEPYKPSLLVRINNFIFPKGTYGEILPPDSVILAENRDVIRKIQKAIGKQMARKRAAKKQAEKKQA